MKATTPIAINLTGTGHFSVLVHRGTPSQPGCCGTNDPNIWHHLLWFDGNLYRARMFSEEIGRAPQLPCLLEHFSHYFAHPRNPWEEIKSYGPVNNLQSEIPNPQS